MTNPKVLVKFAVSQKVYVTNLDNSNAKQFIFSSRLMLYMTNLLWVLLPPYCS